MSRLGDRVGHAVHQWQRQLEQRIPPSNGRRLDAINRRSPSLLISALGQIDDVSQAVTMDLKEPGNLLYQVGLTKDELGGSHFAFVNALPGGLRAARRRGRRQTIVRGVHAAIMAGSVRACHDMSEGGLAAAAAEMAFAGERGARLTLAHVPHDLGSKATTTILLFSESNSRFLCEVRPAEADQFESIMAGVPHARLGDVTTGNRLEIIGLDKASGRAGAVDVDAPLVISADLVAPRTRGRSRSAGNYSMATPRTLILRAPGTNCDVETAYAFERAGAGRPRCTSIVPWKIRDCSTSSRYLCIPGGFSYGDDVAAGRIFGNQIRHHLAEQLHEFVAPANWCWVSATAFRYCCVSAFFRVIWHRRQSAGNAGLERLGQVRRSLGAIEGDRAIVRLLPRHRQHVSVRGPCGRKVRAAGCAGFGRAGSARPGCAALCRVGRQP